MLWLLSCGAKVHGTLIRSPCWPFTYNQKLSLTDKRTLLSTAGPKAYYTKQLIRDSFEQTVTTGVLVSGTGNASIGISSKYSAHHWDFTLVNSQDKDRYERNDIINDFF